MWLRVALLILLSLSSMASAQSQTPERPRTLLDMLFGPKRSAPPPEATPNRKPTRPAKPRRVSKPTVSDTPSIVSPAAPPPIEKRPDAKKILIIGDFVGSGLAEGLNEAFANDENLVIASQTNGSSGLVRSDYFDWPANLGAILDEQKPAVVVVMLGANDRQSIALKDRSLAARTPEWDKEYQARLDMFVKVLTDRSLPFVWVGQPPFRLTGMSQDMLALNALFRSTVGKTDGKFVDVWEGFVDEDGNFTQTGFDINGQTARLRANDGINITTAGKRKLAFYAEKPLKALLGEALLDSTPVPGSQPEASGARIDRVGPISVRDIGRDDSGILLGADPATMSEQRRPGPATGGTSPGRADDFRQSPRPQNP